MSFRLFIYYCALCGGWAALLGWILGRLPDVKDSVADAGTKGLCLGMLIALAIAMVDAFWNLSAFTQIVQGAARVLVAVLVGSIGGMMGAMIGQVLYRMDVCRTKPFLAASFLVFGWTLMGLLIGASVGVYDVLARFLRQEDVGGAIRKLINGAVGGTIGGLLGGFFTVILRKAWEGIFHDKPQDLLWSPSSIGFIVLGACIGLLIGLAQIILKEAWVKVETGRRAGKEMLVSKKEFTIGRAEACDLGLFGDPAIEKAHARIIQTGNRYYLADLNTPGGTYLNGRRVGEPAPLKSGDAIRVGSSTVRFGERAKH